MKSKDLTLLGAVSEALLLECEEACSKYRGLDGFLLVRY